MPQVTIYVLLYSMLLYKKSALTPGGVKVICPQSWGPNEDDPMDLTDLSCSNITPSLLTASLGPPVAIDDFI